MRCNQKLESNRACEAPVMSGEDRCYYHGRAKPNAQRWHANHNARLSMMMGLQPRKDAPLNTERWR